MPNGEHDGTTADHAINMAQKNEREIVMVKSRVEAIETRLRQIEELLRLRLPK